VIQERAISRSGGRGGVEPAGGNAGAASVPALSGAHDEGEERSGRGLVCGDRASGSPCSVRASSAVPASAGPYGPGRRERSDQSRWPTNGSGSADPPSAAAEAMPAASRAQRRAGANHGGRHSVPTAGLLPAAFARHPCRASRPPGPTATSPDGATAEEEADGVSRPRFVEGWRDVCRLVHVG
jgi:hypothetical protein